MEMFIAIQCTLPTIKLPTNNPGFEHMISFSVCETKLLLVQPRKI